MSPMMFLAPTIAVNGEQEIFVKKWTCPWKNELRRRAETKRPYLKPPDLSVGFLLSPMT